MNLWGGIISTATVCTLYCALVSKTFITYHTHTAVHHIVSRTSSSITKPGTLRDPHFHIQQRLNENIYIFLKFMRSPSHLPFKTKYLSFNITSDFLTFSFGWFNSNDLFCFMKNMCPFFKNLMFSPAITKGHKLKPWLRNVLRHLFFFF